MDLKNITMDDLKEKFQSFEKKTLIKFGIGIGAFILFLIIYFAIIIIIHPRYLDKNV